MQPLQVYIFRGYKGFPILDGLQGRLYGINTVHFLIFMVSCQSKIVSFFEKSLNGYIQDSRLNLIFSSLYFNIFKSSLQSHLLYVTLYIFFF